MVLLVLQLSITNRLSSGKQGLQSYCVYSLVVLMTYYRVVTRLTRRVSLVEQELLTLPEYMSSPPVFSGVRVIRLLVYMYVLAIVLSVLLRCTDFDYPLASSNSSLIKC